MSYKDSINQPMPPRWPALVGGGLLNIALGTYYAWSVYVPALEKEFGWTRTQTSFVATIDMVMLASSFLVAGLLQNSHRARARSRRSAACCTAPACFSPAIRSR